MEWFGGGCGLGYGGSLSCLIGCLEILVCVISLGKSLLLIRGLLFWFLI